MVQDSVSDPPAAGRRSWGLGDPRMTVAPWVLVQVTHTTIGAFAGLMVAGRWLELGLVSPWYRVAGAASSTSMLAIALILIFYRAANVVLPPD